MTYRDEQPAPEFHPLQPGDVVRGRFSGEYATVFKHLGRLWARYTDGKCQRCCYSDDYVIVIPASEKGRAEGRGEGPTAVAGPLPPHRYDWPESTANRGSATTGLLDTGSLHAARQAGREWGACPVFPGGE